MEFVFFLLFYFSSKTIKFVHLEIDGIQFLAARKFNKPIHYPPFLSNYNTLIQKLCRMFFLYAGSGGGGFARYHIFRWNSIFTRVFTNFC